MSRITAAHIGIEQLSALTLDEQEQSLPGRYALLPDGQSIEPHINRLYPERLAERALLDFAAPAHGFHLGDAGVASPIERGGNRRTHGSVGIARTDA